MNSAEAKKVLAAYLAGQRVGEEELRRAMAALSGDQTSMRALAEELTGDSPPRDCEMFREQLAEFSEMSPAEREREMPEMAAHLESCASCRRDYWEVAPLWRDLERTAHAAVKQLKEGIRLALSRAGSLLDAGSGLPARDFQPVFGTLSGSPEETPATDSGDANVIRKKWTLRDEEALCEIRLVLDGLPSGQAELSCLLEADPSSDIEVAKAQIEIRDAESRRRIAVGPLANFQRLTLEPGSCVIKLRVEGSGKSHTWEIPLAIEAASEGRHA
jgi:hypothetical protein